jgi:hypothetical protein
MHGIEIPILVSVGVSFGVPRRSCPQKGLREQLLEMNPEIKHDADTEQEFTTAAAPAAKKSSCQSSFANPTNPVQPQSAPLLIRDGITRT